MGVPCRETRGLQDGSAALPSRYCASAQADTLAFLRAPFRGVVELHSMVFAKTIRTIDELFKKIFFFPQELQTEDNTNKANKSEQLELGKADRSP